MMALGFILGCSAKLLVPTTACVGNGIMIAVTALGVIVGGWALWVEEKMEQKEARMRDGASSAGKAHADLPAANHEEAPAGSGKQRDK